jgi:hypothetical protein
MWQVGKQEGNMRRLFKCVRIYACLATYALDSAWR